jgi:hypothetical protein
MPTLASPRPAAARAEPAWTCPICQMVLQASLAPEGDAPGFSVRHVCGEAFSRKHKTHICPECETNVCFFESTLGVFFEGQWICDSCLERDADT